MVNIHRIKNIDEIEQLLLDSKVLEVLLEDDATLCLLREPTVYTYGSNREKYFELSYRKGKFLHTLLSCRAAYDVDQKGRLFVKDKKLLKNSVCAIKCPPNRECHGVSPEQRRFYREDLDFYWAEYEKLDALLKEAGL